MADIFDLSGRVAIITGGSRGIGKMIAEEFVKRGVKTYITSRKAEPCLKTAEELSRHGTCVALPHDLANEEGMSAFVSDFSRRENHLDILINNAGIIRDKSFLKMTDEEWHAVLNVNLTGAFNTCKVVVPIMREAKYGRIINTSSINGTMGAFGQTNYAASKAGIVGFTKSLARETGKYGITVNAVAPGFIKSEMSDSMPKEVIDAGIAMIPVGRIGTAHDIGHAYLFLASKEAGFVTAFTLHVNGGALAI